MEVQEKDKKPRGNALLVAFKLAYGQYKLDLRYVKNISNFWNGKKYLWGRTHIAIAKHNIYWKIIKR